MKAAILEKYAKQGAKVGRMAAVAFTLLFAPLIAMSQQLYQAMDVHCHIVPKTYIEYLEKHNATLDEGFPIPAWDGEKHLSFMDEADIQTSVLTLPAPQPMFGSPEENAAIVRQCNEEAALLKQRHPDRFLFCATLPLPDVVAAVKEAVYAFDVLGAKGVKLATVDVDANLSRLYYDLSGAPTDEAIDALLTITTPDHLLYGSDYPYVAEPVLIQGKNALQSRLAQHGLEPQDVFADNAKRLFGEDIPVRQTGERLVRLAEIEVEPSMLDEYLAFAKEVGTVSTSVEPGVLTLFSMQDKADPCKIYILEIYADQAAYQSHIQTPHFKKYKDGTAKMVKSLKLIDTEPLVGLERLMK